MKLFVYRNLICSHRHHSRGSWLVVAESREEAEVLLRRVVEVCDAVVDEDDRTSGLCPWISEPNFWSEAIEKALGCWTIVPERPALAESELSASAPSTYNLAEDDGSTPRVQQFPNAGCC